MSNAKKLLLSIGAVGASVVSAAASAAVDVSTQVDGMVSDGLLVIGAIGVGMMTLAAGTVVYKWGKAQFF